MRTYIVRPGDMFKSKKGVPYECIDDCHVRRTGLSVEEIKYSTDMDKARLIERINRQSLTTVEPLWYELQCNCLVDVEEHQKSVWIIKPSESKTVVADYCKVPVSTVKQMMSEGYVLLKSEDGKRVEAEDQKNRREYR